MVRACLAGVMRNCNKKMLRCAALPRSVHLFSLCMCGGGFKTLSKRHRLDIIGNKNKEKSAKAFACPVEFFFPHCSLSLKSRRQLRNGMLEKFDFEEVFERDKLYV